MWKCERNWVNCGPHQFMQPVILSEVTVRNANDNAVEGPHSPSGRGQLTCSRFCVMTI
jgi:hypothetical protein